jgi:IclR family acetate operon transcriptional repressor
MERYGGKSIVKSIDNALTVLEYLSSRSEGEKLTNIYKDLGINITAVHRILKTMKKRGFVEQDEETQKYRLGLRAQLLGILGMNQNNLYEYGLSSLNEICKSTLETANLVIRDRWESVYILQVESQNALRVANHVGSRVPLYCTAAGKVLLAYMDNERRQGYYEEVALIPLTPNTLDSREGLEGEIKAIRETGIAYDREEQALGEACIATPVFNHIGELVAAISMSSPASRLTRERMKQFSLILISEGKKLSQRLGFPEETKPMAGAISRR